MGHRAKKRKYPKMPVLSLEPQQEMAVETSKQPKYDSEGRCMMMIISEATCPQTPPACNVPSLLQGLPVCSETLQYASALDQLGENWGIHPASVAPSAYSHSLKCLPTNDPRGISISPLWSFIPRQPMAYHTSPSAAVISPLGECYLLLLSHCFSHKTLLLLVSG